MEKAIETAKKAQGYLIAVTRREGDKLTHSVFTQNFLRNDIFPTLEQWAKLLEPETKEPATSTKEMKKVVAKKVVTKKKGRKSRSK